MMYRNGAGIVLSLGVAICAAGTAFATTPLRYDCTMNNRPARSFMSPHLSVVLDEDARWATVADGMIWQKYHGWKRVDLQVDNPRRATLVWTIREVPSLHASKHTFIDVQETLTLLKQSQRIELSQQPLGGDNSFSASGTCTVRVPPLYDMRTHSWKKK